MAALGFVHVRGCQQDGHAATDDERVDDGPEIAPGDWIDTGRRLVQEEHVGQVDQRADQGQLLPHAAREGAGRPVEERRQPGHPEQAIAVVLVRRAGDTAQLAEELDVLADRERVVEVQTEALRHVADPILDPFGVAEDVDAGHGGRTGVGPQHAGQDL
jgi:hypothetical protein